MTQEPRTMRVQGRVTEATLTAMQHIRLVNPDMNESYLVNMALEQMIVERGKSSEYHHIVMETSVKNSLFAVESIQKRLDMRRNCTELAQNVQNIAVTIQTNPKSETKDSDIEDLATAVYGIKSYSEKYYKTVMDTAVSHLKGVNKKVFNTNINNLCTRVQPPSIIRGGTLDETTDKYNVDELAQNCMTVPANHRQGKIDETLHMIAQCGEDNSMEMADSFVNAVIRAEKKQNEQKQREVLMN